MATKHQVGKSGRKAKPVIRINVVIDGHENEYTTALVNAFNSVPDTARFVRVRSERVRVIKQPERLTAGNSGNRDFGRELKHPRTDHLRLRRTFVFEVAG